MSDPTAGAHSAAEAHRTVEAVVRQQLSRALGGVRGMLEAAVPTATFTVVFLTTRELRLAIGVSLACAVLLLAVRLVQRSSPQFVVNSLVGIGIGAFFAYRSARGGAGSSDQALAYFLPGILINLAYLIGLGASILVNWPLVGFVVGSVTGDPTGWRRDRHVLRLCRRLTWLLVLPCAMRVLVQGPMYLAGHNGWWNTDTAVAALGAAKLAMGWPLQVLALAAMVWLLARNHTPLTSEGPEPTRSRS